MAKNKSKSTEKLINKNDKIQSVLDDIKSKFGDESMMKLGDVKKVDIKAYSTGSISLDRALGIGGMPQGRIIEIYGPESSGKTTICLQVIANAQKEGGVAAFIAIWCRKEAFIKLFGLTIGDTIEWLNVATDRSPAQQIKYLDRMITFSEIEVNMEYLCVAAMEKKEEICIRKIQVD